MINLLKHEFFKIIKNKTILVVLILAFGIALFSDVLFLAMANIDMVGDALDSLGYGYSGSRGIILSASQSMIWLILIAIVVTSIVVTDYNSGVMRNAVMSGQPRVKVFLAKLIVTIGVMLAIVFVINLESTVVYSIFFGWGSVSFGTWILTLLHILLQYTAFTVFAFFIADLTKSTGASIGILLGLTFIFSIFSSLGMRVEMNGEVIFAGNKVLLFISEFYVGNNVSLSANFAIETGKAIKYIIVSLVTIGGSVGGGLALFYKRDFK